MKELPFEHFERVLPLIQESGMRGHLAFIYAVLEGRHPGRVFADNLESPKTSLFCNLTGFYFAFGEPVEELVWPTIAGWFAEPLSREMTAIYASSARWNALLSKLLPEEYGPRLAFELKKENSIPDWRSRIPPGFAAIPVTEDLARSIEDGTGTGNFGIDPWFIRISGGPKAYVEQGLGVAVVEESTGQIASVSGFCALGRGEAEMEVGTTPAYRGRGLATLSSAAFMEQCAISGWRPAYSCNIDNLASISVAHRLGFVEVEEVKGFLLPSKTG